jgi:hypothetical protein
MQSSGSGSGRDLAVLAREFIDANRSRRSQADGAGQWHGEDVRAPAPHRVYRAKASQHFVLGANDRRIPVQLGQGPEPRPDTEPAVSG